MPREFQDFSAEVSTGSDKISAGLAKVREAADGADLSSAKLSKTHESGIRTADTYVKTMAGVSRSLANVRARTTGLSSSLSDVDNAARMLGSSLRSIRDNSEDAQVGIGGLTDVAGSALSALREISKAKVDPTFNVRGAIDARKSIESVTASVDSLKKESESAFSRLSKVVTPLIKVALKQKIVGPKNETVEPNITVKDVKRTVKAVIKQVIEYNPDVLSSSAQVNVEDVEKIVAMTVRPNIEMEDFEGAVKAKVFQDVELSPDQLQVKPNVELDDEKARIIKAKVGQEIDGPKPETVSPNIEMEDFEGAVKAKVVVDADDLSRDIEDAIDKAVEEIRSNVPSISVPKFDIDKGLNDALTQVRSELETARQLEDYDKVFELSLNVSGIGFAQGLVSSLDDAAKKMVEARAEATGLDSTLEELADSSSSLFKRVSAASEEAASAVSKFQPSLESAAQGLEDVRFSVPIANQVKEAQAAIVAFEEQSERLTGLEKTQFIRYQVEVAGLREFEEYVKTLPLASRGVLAATASSEGLFAAMSQAASGSKDFAANLISAGKAAERAARSSNTFTNEVENVESAMDAVNNKLAEGQREAQSFAGGIGVGNGLLIGAGAAVAFLAVQVNRLLTQFQDSAIQLAKFNVELGALDARAAGLGIVGSFNDIRKELSLTRAEASDFFNVFSQGAQSGVVSADRLREAAVQLQNTFGGDPTQRLREYVEILQSIPSVETDLKVNASLDDKAAAIFALAEAGQVEKVIELQAAGLLSGIGETLAEEDTNLLNVQQKAEGWLEGIHDLLVGKLFPTIGPWATAAMGTGLKVVAGVGGIVATIGALKAFLGPSLAAQLVAQNATTSAVMATGGIKIAKAVSKKNYITGLKSKSGGGRTAVGEGLSKLGSGFKSSTQKSTRGIVSAVNRVAPSLASTIARFAGTTAATGAASAAAGGAVAGAAGGAVAGGGLAAAGAAASAVAIPAAIAVAAIAFVGALAYGGKKISDWGDTLESEGKKTKAGFAQLAGGLAKGAAAFAVGGPLASVAFGAEDVGKGLENIGTGLQDTAGGIYRFGENTRWAGEKLIVLGATVTDVMSKVKSLPGAIKRGAINFASDIGDKIVSFFEGDDYKAAQKAAAGDLRALNLGLEGLRKTSEQYDKSLLEIQKAEQRSALSLQRQLQGLKSATESAKFKLVELGQAIAEAELDTISDFGGSSMAFNRAVADGSRMAEGRFTQMEEVLREARVNLASELKSGRINAAMAQGLELRLREQQIANTRKFIESQLKLAKAFLNAPKIIEAGLSAEIATARFELEGMVGFGDAGFGEVEKSIDATIAKNAELAKRAEEAREKAAGIGKALGDAGKAAAKEFEENLGQYSKGARERIRELLPKDGGDFDSQQVTQAFDDLRAKMAETRGELDRVTQSLPDEMFAKTARQLVGAKGAAKGLAEQIKQLEKQISEAKTDEDASRLESQKGELIAKKAKVQDRIEAAEQALQAKIAKQVGQEELTVKQKTALSQLVGLAAREQGATIDELVQMGRFTEEQIKFINKISEDEKKALAENGEISKTLSEIASLSAELGEDAQVAGFLSGIVSLANGANAELQALVEVERKLLEGGSQIMDAIMQSAKVAELAIGPQRRELEAVKARQGVASVLGGLSENILQQREAEIDFAKASVKATKDRLEIEKERARVAQEQIDAGNLSREAEISARAIVQGANAARAALLTQQAEALSILGSIGEGITTAVQSFADSVAEGGKAIEAELELGGVEAEVARFSRDYEQAIGRTTSRTIAAEQERFRKVSRIIQDTAAAELASIDSRVEGMVDTGEITQAQAVATRETLRRQALAKKQTEEAQAELRLKKAIVEAAQMEADIKMERVNLEGELIDAQKEFVNSIGGSFTTILSLEKQGIQIEMMKLNILQDQLSRMDESDKRTIRGQTLINNIEMQRMKIIQKSMGAQKSAFDNLLGNIFGALRGSVGAATGRDAPSAKFGRDMTRVMGRSGIYLRETQGLLESINDRANRLRIGAAGAQILGGRGEGIGAAGIKDQEARIIELNERQTKTGEESRDALVNLNREGTQGRSLHTHDYTAVDKLVLIHRQLVDAHSDHKEWYAKYMSMCRAGQGESETTKPPRPEPTANEPQTEEPLTNPADARRESAGVSAEGQEIAENTAAIAKTLISQFMEEKKNYRELQNKLRDGNLDGKERTSLLKALGESESSMKRLESDIRKIDAYNPFAGGVRGDVPMVRATSLSGATDQEFEEYVRTGKMPLRPIDISEAEKAEMDRILSGRPIKESDADSERRAANQELAARKRDANKVRANQKRSTQKPFTGPSSFGDGRVRPTGTNAGFTRGSNSFREGGIGSLTGGFARGELGEVEGTIGSLTARYTRGSRLPSEGTIGSLTEGFIGGNASSGRNSTFGSPTYSFNGRGVDPDSMKPSLEDIPALGNAQAFPGFGSRAETPNVEVGGELQVVVRVDEDGFRGTVKKMVIDTITSSQVRPELARLLTQRDGMMTIS
jgi:hypothetical protein